jgi:nucleotide-binding universal stress UspA family protein
MKILWAYNPFDKNKELQKNGEVLLSNLFDKKDSINVLYVASNAETELATSFNISKEKRYSEYPKKLIKEQLKKLSSRKMLVEVLQEENLSLTSLVKNVVVYSKEKQMDLIFIASNSKNALQKFVLGSFAETLVHLSVCDLFIYQPDTKFSPALVANIIYAHDFSSKGILGLERVIEYAKRWNSTLTVVHVPIPEMGMEVHEFKDLISKRAMKVTKILEKKKIKFKIHIKYEVRTIAETLLAVSLETGGIIAVAAHSNRLAAFLGGSITRQILRESPIPTLVLKLPGKTK